MVPLEDAYNITLLFAVYYNVIKVDSNGKMLSLVK